MTRSRSALSLAFIVFFILGLTWRLSHNFDLGGYLPKNILESVSKSTADKSVVYDYRVVKVVDGDTIDVQPVSGGEIKRVRYIGMNTPETVDPRRPVQCFGREASDFNKSMVATKMVRLEKDVSDTDKYGRLLRFVYLPKESGGEIMINEILVREGYARIDTVPPDVSHTALFREAEAEARINKRGLWSACSKTGA